MIVEDYVSKYVDPALEQDFMDILNRYSGNDPHTYDSDIDIDELDWCNREARKLAKQYRESKKMRSREIRESRYNDPVLGKKIEDALADIEDAQLPEETSRKIKRLIRSFDEPDADTTRIISQIDDEADNLAAKGFVDEAEIVSDAIATLRQLDESAKKPDKKSVRESDSSYIDDSKKRKVISRVSMREAKEDVDREIEFEKKLSDAGLIFASKGKKVAISYDKNPAAFAKARELADEVKEEFGGDYQIGMDSSGRATFTFTDQSIVYGDYEDEPIKADEGSGELTDDQKSIIEDIAQSDYEVGHPMSEEDALDWFSSGEEEDIPVDLAQEAADYYFEAFDQVREDDNLGYDDE